MRLTVLRQYLSQRLVEKFKQVTHVSTLQYINSFFLSNSTHGGAQDIFVPFAFFMNLSIFVSKHHSLPQGGNTQWKLKSIGKDPKTQINKEPKPKNFPKVINFSPYSHVYLSVSLPVSSPL